MPEAPDLEVMREVLTRRVVGRPISDVRVLRPTVLRSFAAQDFAADLVGRTFSEVSRRGKFLIFACDGSGPEARLLVINPMLTGTLQLCDPAERVLKRTCIVLTFDGDQALRYVDDRQMGKVYYVSGSQVGQVPRLEEQGPDGLNDPIGFDEFKARLRQFHGEVKGMLTRGAFVSGIGNAYSDEVLFAAGISPFRKRKTLSDEELARLHACVRDVVADAVMVLRERMGETTRHKIRDFLRSTTRADSRVRVAALLSAS